MKDYQFYILMSSVCILLSNTSSYMPAKAGFVATSLLWLAMAAVMVVARRKR